MASTDVELMLRCREDPGALEALVERYEQPLMNFIARMIGDRVEAEDLFQETFVRVMRSAGRYTPKARFSTWLFTIARNLSIDHLKKRRGLPTVPLDSIEEEAPAAAPPRTRGRGGEPEGSGPDPSEAAATAESVVAVRRAIAALSPPKREALTLRLYQGLPYAEIAQVVRAPVGTVKFRVHEAVREVAEALGVPREQVDLLRKGGRGE
ncbi:MAG: sigma-70 family RNA polymerase sigma factor [Planctomycetales bacterium]|nr:sigma-70 family RNA polymerase sigma factor [Planctomycetales bacterium]